MAEDVPAAGEADDRVDGQEVRRIFERLDQPQLVLQNLDHLVGQALGVTAGRTFPGQFFQRLLRREARHRFFLGVLIGELVEREPAAAGDFDRARQGLRIIAEQPRHFIARFEIAVGMTFAAEAGVIDGDVVANAGDDILHHAAGRLVEKHVIGNDGSHPHRGRQVSQLVKPELVVRAPAQGERQIGAIAEDLAQPPQTNGTKIIGVVGHQDRDQTFAIGDDIIPIEMAFCFAGPALAERQQAAEPRISRSIGWIGQDRHAVGEIETAADDQPDACRLCRFMRAHDAGKRIAIDDSERLDAEQCRLRKQLLAG